MLAWSCKVETLILVEPDVAKTPFPYDTLQILQYITPSSLLNCNQLQSSNHLSYHNNLAVATLLLAFDKLELDVLEPFTI